MNWNYEYTDGSTEAFILRDDGAVIARLETEAGTNAHEMLEQNIRRIVACVNAYDPAQQWISG